MVPTLIRLFDDFRSFLHVAVAALSVLLRIDIAATVLFLAYELTEDGDRFYLLGDMVEWGIGLFIGAALRLYIH